MKKLLYAIIAAVSLASGSAMSADLAPAVFAPPPPPLVVPAYTWTGCYLGGNAGAAFSTWTYANPTDNPTIPGTRGQISVNDVIAGGQVGCDYQTGDLVFGVQGAFDWSPHLEGRFFDAVTSFFQESAQARWTATATGRIGYTVTPQALFYVKGGAAWVRNNYEDISDFASAPPLPPGCPNIGVTGCNTVNATNNATRLGFVAGLGVEYMFAPNWSVFVEYDYLDFGTANVTFNFAPGTIPSTNTFQVFQHIQQIVAGINFRFNFGGPVVAARY